MVLYKTLILHKALIFSTIKENISFILASLYHTFEFCVLLLTLKALITLEHLLCIDLVIITLRYKILKNGKTPILSVYGLSATITLDLAN